MKKAKAWISSVVFSIAVTLCACGQLQTGGPLRPSPAPRSIATSGETSCTPEASPDASAKTPMTADGLPEDFSESGNRQLHPGEFPFTEELPFTGELPLTGERAFPPEPLSLMAEAGPYTGMPYTAVNGNVPYFSEEDLTAQSYESYSGLDALGRCGTACASVGLDLMPVEERGPIGQIKPSGWHLVKYDSVNGRYLYNRCHLIGYQLSGENANEQNLITGTRYLNVEGMLPFENMVADYVKETRNHVLYRVTPVFEGDNLLASGVLMEAESVEDKGEGILFCVYVYNVQPGIIIDYATGESCLDPGFSAAEDPADERDALAQSQAAPPQNQTAPPQSQTGPAQSQTTPPQSQTGPVQSQTTPHQSQAGPAADIPQDVTYILNTNTMKFHYPSCSSVDQMKDSNKKESSDTRDAVISQGYVPCKRCNP